MADTKLNVVNFGPGHTLMKQGDHGNMAWLLQDGEVEVFSETGAGRISLARLQGKQVVGEMALIDNGLRTATVVVKSPVTATEIPREAFTRMFNSCEPMARHVLSHLVNAVRASRGIAVTESSISGPTIRSSEDSDRILERRVFGAGTFIFRENDPGEAAYLIQSGSVNIVQGGTKIIATLLPGRTFGEMALLRNGKRIASAVVGENGAAVEIIRRREFEKAINSMPKILRVLTQAYLGYLLTPQR